LAYDYDGNYPFQLASGADSVYDDQGRGRWWNAESMGVLRAGRHTLMLGGELTRNARQDQAGGYVGQAGSDLGLPDAAFRIPDHGLRYGAFAQDDVALGRRLRLSLGGRYDHHEDFGSVVHPRLALIATPDASTTIKLLYGSAYRAPNEYEQNYYPAQREASELEPETIGTFEAALERRLGQHVRLSASIFSNEIDELISLESNAAGKLLFQNTGQARSWGTEAGLEARFPSGTAFRLNYSFQHTRDGAGRSLSNSPVHMLKGVLSVPVWRRGLWGGLDAQYVSSRLTLAGNETGGFVLLDAHLLAARLWGRLELSAGVYNALDVRYADPASEEHAQDSIPQNGRNFSLRLGWTF
jgi:iron complex outermembrane receptor protein